MHVVIDMNAHREAIKMSKQALADKVHKDVSVVAKQITETKRTNMMLFNAYEFADALGGAIIFATDEQLEAYQHIDEYKKAAQEAESLRAENDKLKIENEKVMDRETKLLEKLDKMQDKLDHKDASIERKDALLLTLLKQKELMTKALHKAGVDLSFLEFN